jgi:hypothetical protein
MVFLAFAKGLRIDDDLMFAVHRGHICVTLQRALTRRHLGRLVVGDVAFDFRYPFPLTFRGLATFKKRSIRSWT